MILDYCTNTLRNESQILYLHLFHRDTTLSLFLPKYINRSIYKLKLVKMFGNSYFNRNDTLYTGKDSRRSISLHLRHDEFQRFGSSVYPELYVGVETKG